ncbi:MAG: sulfatase [Bryobacterales bacterium]|nr:sulfatase [Bryobacterales bacterium]
MALSLSPATREKLKDIFVCFSLGNLCFVRRWYDLEILQETGLDYLRPGPASPTLLVSTLVAGLLLAAVFWIGWQWAQKRGRLWIRFAQGCFLMALVFPLESVRRYWNAQFGHIDLISNVALLSIETLLFGGLILAMKGNSRVVRPARHVALMMTFMFPALLIDFLSSRLSSEPASAFQPKISAAAVPVRADAPRVIWIIFDEMDQRIAFNERPVSLDLPELDRLRSESLEARRATQTAGFTGLAMPILISGRSYRQTEIRGASKLDVFPENSSEQLDWAEEHTVFRRAREMGVNAAISGWYHPYCRIFGDLLVDCFANSTSHAGRALLREQHAAQEGVARMTAFLFKLQLENIKDLYRFDGLSGSENLKDAFLQSQQQQEYFQIRDHAYADATDPRFGFLMLHFPTPHMYAIYNRWRRDFTLDSTIDYLDNLALVDRTLGELRAKLEAAGLWDRTTILITADHGFRPDLWRGRYGWTQNMERISERGTSQLVPFILKLAGKRDHLVVDRPFSNIVSSDLALAVLRGQISTAAQASDWIERRTNDSENSAKHGASAGPSAAR